MTVSYRMNIHYISGGVGSVGRRTVEALRTEARLRLRDRRVKFIDLVKVTTTEERLETVVRHAEDQTERG